MRRLLLVVALIAAVAAPAAGANPSVLDVSPKKVRFGTHAFGTLTDRTITLTNTGRRSVVVDVESLVMPDDFAPGQPASTCTLFENRLLAPGESCTHVVSFQPDTIFPGHRKALLGVTVEVPATGALIETHTVRLTGRAVEP
jgi:hypothetical protein